MPAPTQASIEAFLTNSLLQSGYGKKSYDSDGVLVTDQTVLPDDMKRLVQAMSIGMAAQWAAWTSTAVVYIPVTGATGAPSVGTLQ